MPQERELKLVPEDVGLLDVLSGVDRLGSLARTGTRLERQRNAFFDSPSRALEAARIGFRRREVDGERLATWTIKGQASSTGGVATRDEVELLLSAATPPAMALSALRQAAMERGAPALGEAVGDALRAGGLPLAQPYLETRTERCIVDLADQQAEVELALDRMAIVDHDYAEVEIEAELKRGSVEALHAVRGEIERLGEVRESEGSKLSRAMAHVRTCRCDASGGQRAS